MSSDNSLNLKVNSLQEEIILLGLDLGVFWNLISPNGLASDGGNTACNIAATANNTMNAYSSVKRNGQWSITCRPQINGNMFVGISTNLSTVFPGASSPSMANCNYGVLFDLQNGSNTSYLIFDGVITGSIPVNPNDKIQYEYDGTSFITYTNLSTGNYIEVHAPALGDVWLVCGSFYGGYINAITWNGPVSSGPVATVPTLEQVLTVDGDANKEPITNISYITVSDGGYALDTIVIPPQVSLNTSALAYTTASKLNTVPGVSMYRQALDTLFSQGTCPYTRFDVIATPPGGTLNQFSLSIPNTSTVPFDVILYVTDTADAPYDNSNNYNVCYRLTGILPGGSGSYPILAKSIVMTYQKTAVGPTEYLYINYAVVTTGIPNFTYRVAFAGDLDGTAFRMMIASSIFGFSTAPLINI